MISSGSSKIITWSWSDKFIEKSFDDVALETISKGSMQLLETNLRLLKSQREEIIKNTCVEVCVNNGGCLLKETDFKIIPSEEVVQELIF